MQSGLKEIDSMVIYEEGILVTAMKLNIVIIHSNCMFNSFVELYQEADLVG